MELAVALFARILPFCRVRFEMLVEVGHVGEPFGALGAFVGEFFVAMETKLMVTECRTSGESFTTCVALKLLFTRVHLSQSKTSC